MEKQEFAHALSGKPENRRKTNDNCPLLGYIIRDMQGFLYVTNTTIHINKWRKIKAETDLFYVIEENLNPFEATRFFLYKTREIAEEHLEELKSKV